MLLGTYYAQNYGTMIVGPLHLIHHRGNLALSPGTVDQHTDL